MLFVRGNGIILLRPRRSGGLKQEDTDMKIKSLDGDFTICKVADFLDVNFDAEYCFTAKPMKKIPLCV